MKVIQRVADNVLLLENMFSKSNYSSIIDRIKYICKTNYCHLVMKEYTRIAT